VCLCQGLEWAWLLLSPSLLFLLKMAPCSRKWRSPCGSQASFKTTLLVLVMKALRLKRDRGWPFIPRKERILGFPVPSAEVSSVLWRAMFVLLGDLLDKGTCSRRRWRGLSRWKMGVLCHFLSLVMLHQFGIWIFFCLGKQVWRLALKSFLLHLERWRVGEGEYEGTESFLISENYCFPYFLGSRWFVVMKNVIWCGLHQTTGISWSLI